MRYAAALPSIGLLAGAAIGLVVEGPDPSRIVVAAMAAASAIVMAIAISRRRHHLIFSALLVSVFFVGGMLLAADAWERAWRPPLRAIFEERARLERAEAEAAGQRRPLDDEANLTLEGILRADASPSAGGVSLSLAVNRVAVDQAGVDRVEREGFSRASGGVLLTVIGELARNQMTEWRAGRRVRLHARLQRPQRYLDPDVPDAERSLARRGTTLVGTVKSGGLVEVLARARWWDEVLSATRRFARVALANSVDRFSTQSGGIVAAIVIGDRSRLEPDVQRRLQDAGTFHVVAISGGNIAILAGVLLWMFRVVGWFGRPATMAAIVLLWAYARFVGGGASVDRATLMAVVYLGARLFDQRTPPMNALLVVVAVLVASDPLSVADPAFLLTCGATLAILVTSSRFDPHVHGALRPVVRIVVASAAAEAVLLPVGAALFSRVTFAGLFLNVLAIPLMSVAQIAGMLVVPAAMLSATAATVAGWVAHVGALGLVWSADLVRFAPIVSWRVPPPSTGTSTLYYAGLGITCFCWCGYVDGLAKTRLTAALRFLGLALWFTAGLWILWNPALALAARGDGRLHMTFLDVGQGDSTFIIFPRGATMLVDAGGLSFSSGFDIGDRVVAPVIRESGYRRLDRLVLTHGDPDHIGGAVSVLSEFRPWDIWEGIPVPRSEALTTLRLAAQSRGARWANVYAGDAIRVDGVDIVAWHPSPPDWERQKVRNDDSLVLELRWRDVSILLTGDIGRVPEAAIASAFERIRSAEPGLRPIRVVKIPHHGSLTSSSVRFVDVLRPQIAVVSAGRSNHFGHPVPEVLERYRAVGAQVFRTDRDGAVFVETDGRTVSVWSHENTK